VHWPTPLQDGRAKEVLLGRHRRNRAATSPNPAQRERRVSCSALGAAVLLQWNDLPTPIQQQLSTAPLRWLGGQTAQLKEQIARFLHMHKDARASR
jgi:hypothetical protein